VRQAYLDGELCAVDAKGLTSFAAMQAATDHRPPAKIRLLHLRAASPDGEDLSRAPLIERKGRLEKLLARAAAGLR
jgi:ATP-dependent DNA ligase